MTCKLEKDVTNKEGLKHYAKKKKDTWNYYKKLNISNCFQS